MAQQVDSPESLENVETKWVSEIADNCPGVKLVLVALKCDLRKREEDDGEEGEEQQPETEMINYEQGLKVAERIKALRYMGTLSLVSLNLPPLGSPGEATRTSL